MVCGVAARLGVDEVDLRWLVAMAFRTPAKAFPIGSSSNNG
jgi:hypothetical protein